MNLRQQLKCELARRDFWEYCKLMHPEFYKEDRLFLQDLCTTLQEFYYNDQEVMIINMPPRHGKSFTATNFVEWILGKNPQEKIISASYNHKLSKTFSKKCRNTIESVSVDGSIIYNDIFPNTKIKFGSAEATQWQTDKSNQVNYLASTPNGSATGFGCTMMVIDDVIKNAYEANNEMILDDHWDWFRDTMYSRREGKKKMLFIMTRWSSKDLAGRILEFVQKEKLSYSHINYVAEQKDRSMLCEDLFSKRDNELSKKGVLMSNEIYYANYQQEPIDMKGALYSNLKTYTKKPEFITIENYTDTADEGEDYLCSIDYGVYNGQAYILDIIFTQDPMEITEPLVAGMITKDWVNYCKIESNNGGKGFGRNVERIVRENGNRHTEFLRFTQTKNKVARILTAATGVMQNIYFPEDWQEKYPEFYKQVVSYQRMGKNKHDDCSDVLSGIYENLVKYQNNDGW